MTARAGRASLSLVLLLTGAVLLASPVEAAAQAVEPRTPVERTEFGGRVHIQMNTSSEVGVPSTEYRVRRARLWGATRINRWLDGAVLVDLAGSTASARYAFVRFSPTPSFRLSAGQFKRAFDLFELTSSGEMLVVERDGEVRGVSACPGVGGLCTYSRFSEELGLSSLDVGLLAEGEVGRLGYLVSVTNGTGANAREDNDAKSYSARITVATPGLVLGLNGALKDYTVVRTGEDAHAGAWSVDVEAGAFEEPGWHLQAALMGGANWKADREEELPDFLAAQAVLSYRIPLAGQGPVRALEPLGRFSWGDPLRSVGEDDGVLLTPGVALHFDGRNKVVGNVDVWRPAAGASAWSFKATALVYF